MANKPEIKPSPPGGSALFADDLPIKSAADDRLARAPFAAAIAKAIAGWSSDASLVVAIYGPWGSGKTSVKNFVLESLQERKLAIDTVEFNPWQFTDPGTLSQAFFRDIGVALGTTDKSEKGRQTAARWRAWGAALALSQSIGDLVRRALITTLAVVAAFGLGLSFIESVALRWIVGAIYVVVLVVLRMMSVSKELIDKTASWIEARNVARGKTMGDQKRDLIESLASRAKPMLVIIDDVDRLTPNDIRQLVRLIKAHADLPNLVYLLLTQRDIVERALDEPGQNGSGRQFLEKIVQAGFDLPVADRTQLIRILAEGLDAIVADKSVGKHFDEERWREIFNEGVGKYFGSLRAIHRFLSSLRFAVGVFKVGEPLEVNIIDLIALETLRLFEPDVYRQLPSSKEILTKKHEKKSMFSLDPDVAKRAVDEIVQKAHTGHKEQVEHILKTLFPHTEWMFGGSKHSDSDDKWLRDLRVCSEDVFNRYFQLATPVGDISQARFEQVIASAGDRALLVTNLRALKNEGMLDVVMDRLDSYKQEINLDHARPFITGLFDFGEELPAKRPSFFETSPDSHTSRIVLWYLKKEEDPEKRRTILLDAIEQTSGLYLAVRQVHWEVDLHKDGKQDAQLTSDPTDLKQACIAKIKAWAVDGRLAKSPHRQFVLYRWINWTDGSDARAWVAQVVESDRGLLDFLAEFPMPAPMKNPLDHISHDQWRYSLDAVENVIPLDALAKRLEKLPTSSSEDAELVATYLGALKWRASLPKATSGDSMSESS